MLAVPETNSLAVWLTSLPEPQRQAVLAELNEEQTKALLYNWHFWARPNQLAPPGDWFTWLIRAGRGFGKTRTGAEWVIDRVKKGYRRIALVGQTKADVRDTMVELGDSSILQASPPWLKPYYEPSKRRLTWPNGAVAIIYSGDEPDQLRGPQHDSAWVDEIAKFKYPEPTWNNLEFGLRLGDKPQVVVTTTPRPIPIMRQIINDPHTVETRGSSYDNIHNLASAFIERVLSRYEGTRLGRQELHAELLEDVPGALWTRDLIERNRVFLHPPLTTVVVGVDPAASTGETGIVVAGRGIDGHGYVLEDLSTVGSPDTWAGQAVVGYHKNMADRIAAEANNGGDMVIKVIQTVDKSVATVKLWASRGKVTRAEPVSALYEQNKVHHVGMFATLEDELCTWVSGESSESPNRLDALVWALTEIMLKKTSDKPKVRSHSSRSFK